MGYTAYYREMNNQLTQEQIDIGNNLYRTLLANIIHPGSKKNLLEIFNEGQDSTLFDECFHEWAVDDHKLPVLFSKDDPTWAFCKTARKIYDLAVYATLKTIHDEYGIEFSYDADIDDYPRLIDYAMNELEIDKYKYDYLTLEEVCICFGEKLENARWAYTRISEISEVDREYIAKNIKEGNSTIYLSNGTVVKLTIE